MPIQGLTPRLPEVGRIRLGIKVPIPSKPGKTRPEKLDTLRFTSADEDLLKIIGGEYGGLVEPWEDAPTGDRFQLISETTWVDVFVPPVSMGFSQHMELWRGAMCERRCDRETCTTYRVGTDDEVVVERVPCLCTPRDEDCKFTTRLGVVLANLPSTGLWRLESHGYNAAVELLGSTELIRAAQQANGQKLVAARLRVEWRKKVVSPKLTNVYVVPVLDISASVTELFSGGVPALAAGPERALPAAANAALPTGLAAATNGNGTKPQSTGGACPVHGAVANLTAHLETFRKAGRPCPGDASTPASEAAPAPFAPEVDPLQERIQALDEETRALVLERVRQAQIPELVDQLDDEQREAVEAILELAEEGALVEQPALALVPDAPGPTLSQRLSALPDRLRKRAISAAGAAGLPPFAEATMPMDVEQLTTILDTIEADARRPRRPMP